MRVRGPAIGNFWQIGEVALEFIKNEIVLLMIFNVLKQHVTYDRIDRH
jgi:hypothetical protein